MSRLPDNGDTKSKLPIKEIAAGVAWLRGSDLKYKSPVNWSKTSEARYNAASRRFGTLYLAQTITGVLAESVCRGAAYLHDYEKSVSEIRLNNLGLYVIELDKPITVVDFTVPNLARYRLDARITTEYSSTRPNGPYEYGPAWTDHLKKIGLDGILYHSRHHTTSVCLALFEGATTLKYELLHSLNEDDVIKILEQEFDWSIDPS